jgi:hypothetical protein
LWFISAEDPENGHLNPIYEALASVGSFRPVPTPPPVPISEDEADVYSHSRVELACARLSAFREGLPGLQSKSELDNRTAAVAAAAAVVRGFYSAVLKPLDTSGKGPALAFLPEEISRVLKSPRDCLKNVQTFSKMFDANGLHAERVLRQPKFTKEQSEAEDALLVELLRAGQALNNMLAAVEGSNGPASNGPAVSCKSCRDDGGSDWLGKLASCLVKEAKNTCKRLRNRVDRSCLWQDEGELWQLAAAIRRLQRLTDQLETADPTAAEQARGALLRESSPSAAGASTFGTTLSSTSGNKASAHVWRAKADPLDFLCRFVLLGFRESAGARALDAEHDEMLALCLRELVLREVTVAKGCAAGQDIGEVCLVWWASAELATEVRCSTCRTCVSEVCGGPLGIVGKNI